MAWKPVSRVTVSVDHFESSKNPNESKKEDELKRTAEERTQLLLQCGHCAKEIKASTKESDTTRKNREESQKPTKLRAPKKKGFFGRRR